MPPFDISLGDSIPEEELNPLLRRRLITGEKGMLAHVYLDKGAVVPLHSHHNEQFTYVLEGALHFWIGDDESEEIVVHAGEVPTSRPMCHTKPRHWRTRWTWTSSFRPGRTGCRGPTTISVGSGDGSGIEGEDRPGGGIEQGPRTSCRRRAGEGRRQPGHLRPQRPAPGTGPAGDLRRDRGRGGGSPCGPERARRHRPPHGGGDGRVRPRRHPGHEHGRAAPRTLREPLPGRLER